MDISKQQIKEFALDVVRILKEILTSQGHEIRNARSALTGPNTFKLTVNIKGAVTNFNFTFDDKGILFLNSNPVLDTEVYLTGKITYQKEVLRLNLEDYLTKSLREQAKKKMKVSKVALKKLVKELMYITTPDEVDNLKDKVDTEKDTIKVVSK